MKLLSASKDNTPFEDNWKTEYWSDQENYSDTLSASYDTRVLMITSDSLTVNRWYKKIDIKPYAEYKIYGFIKTEGVKGKHDKSGAGFRIGKFPIENDTIFTGDNDWTYVEIQFNAEGDDSVMLECLLGKGGSAKGKVYFDNIKIEEISVPELNPKAVIDVTVKKESISPYMYGQFIEHMGKSIYGGLWAELLEDRKFYYTPGSKKSAWKINLDTLKVKKDSTMEYARAPIPVFPLHKNVLELTQDSISVVDKQYEGRLVFKADPGVKQINIALITGEDIVEQNFDIQKSGYIKQAFLLTSSETDENAKLRITFQGIGTVTVAAVSLMPSDHIKGFRKDVVALMKSLNAPVYRWPGGNFVSGYNWKDGIGDPDTRPTQYERAWKGLEYNDVGIHEFMELCELLDAKANIAVNTGLGTAKLAAEEVEYVNGGVKTKMGKWRAENGHPAPYNVKLWAVGNEMFGDWQLGHMPIKEYVKKHNRVSEAMREVDRDISLIAVGFPGEWNQMMYEHCSNQMTYISEHFYRQDWHAGGLLTHVRQIPDAIREIANEHRKWRDSIPELKQKDIKIALDEWNYWYGPHEYGLLGTRYFLRDALGIAAGINEFSRQSDIYYMANYAQTVNVIGAIKTTPTASWLEGTGLVLELYNQEFGEIPVSITGSFEPLDVAATITDDGKYLTLSVVNATHRDYPLKIEFKNKLISEEGVRYTITGEHDMVFNDEENSKRIALTQTEFSIKNGHITIPRESANIYKIRIEE